MTMDSQWSLAKAQLPLQTEDLYWNEPNQSSLKLASDYHPAKVATDIVVQGFACAPENQRVRQLDVLVSVGSISKRARVFGRRQWGSGGISQPEPFERIALVYENAFGGRLMDGEEVKVENPHNPFGCGEFGDHGTPEGQILPNIEDPDALIKHPHDKPLPTGFAPIAPGWQPRVGYAGTYDEAWQQERAPYLPHDFDPRFFNVASPGLIYPGFLVGGEPIHIVNMHPQGEIKTSLPRVNLIARIDMGEQIEQPQFNIETVTIEPTQGQLSMVWKASYPCDKKMLKIKEVAISTSR